MLKKIVLLLKKNKFKWIMKNEKYKLYLNILKFYFLNYKKSIDWTYVLILYFIMICLILSEGCTYMRFFTTTGVFFILTIYMWLNLKYGIDSFTKQEVNTKKLKRKLIDISMEEVIVILKLSEGWQQNTDYKMKVMYGSSDAFNVSPKQWIRVYYEWEDEERIVMNISDTKDAIDIISGNRYYRTIYRIVKYLQNRGFDLDGANDCG